MSWLYSDTVKEHFFNPKNIVCGREPEWEFNGVGEMGSAACGDVMRMWIYVEPKTRKIKKCGWQTFGCASAIASTSVLSEMVTEKGGMVLEKAIKITPQDIIARLGGLPAIKIHCSVLGDQALRKAIENFERGG